jgi:nucleoside-diphosphate-sugar epimerase
MACYLVTGAAGFIASQIAESLLADGHSVVGVDNMNAAYDVRMKEYRLRQLQAKPAFTFQKLDIADRKAVQSLVKLGPYEAVFNLAARAGVREAMLDPWMFIDTNLTGTLNLLDLCRQMDSTKKFILASTSGVYGANPPLPTPEDFETDHPLQPYAASKKAAEVMCHAYHYLYGIDVTIFRYFNVYGPAGRPDAIMFRLIQWVAEGVPVKIYGDGQQTRGFTHVQDVVHGTLLGLQPLGYEIINLGGHSSITIQSLLEIVEAEIGMKAQVEHHPAHRADIFASQADIRKAESLLGWKPQVSVEEGIRMTVAWYLAERAWSRLVETQ